MRGERKREMKFDKKKCKKCKYHRKFPSGQFVFCNYASLTDQTCLKKVGKEIIDIRGDKFDGCKLFCEGKAMDDKIEKILMRGNEYEGDN